ncbi:MAG: hypothetical protein HY510_02735 [Acidobacteria bacterium]|nr:hypothetical protein [Acidobacteriota bacterium]
MLTPVWYPDSRQLRQFAFAALFGFGLIGLLSWRWSGSARGAFVLWGIGAAAFLLGLPFPAALRPLYVVLMAAAHPVGWVVSSLLLRLIFYGVFTPLGWAFRMVGRDPLLLKRPRTGSYWRDFRRPKDVTSYYRQA